MLLWSVFLAANISPRLLDPSELFLSISQTALARLDCYDSQVKVTLQAHVEFSWSHCRHMLSFHVVLVAAARIASLVSFC